MAELKPKKVVIYTAIIAYPHLSNVNAVQERNSANVKRINVLYMNVYNEEN
jgi:hypothetical protein